MNPTVVTSALYLLIAIALTIWVARTLHRNGRIFLVDCFHGNEELALQVDKHELDCEDGACPWPEWRSELKKGKVA